MKRSVRDVKNLKRHHRKSFQIITEAETLKRSVRDYCKIFLLPISLQCLAFKMSLYVWLNET